MSQAMVGRIFWKELRVQRAFWMWILGLGAFIQLAPILLGRSYYRSAFESHWFSSVDVVMACCFAAGSTAIAFAGETENRTKSLFQRLPVRISDLLVGKLGWSLLGTYALFLILAIVSELCGDSRVASVVHDTRARHVFDQQAADFWYSLVAPLPFVVIGLFCSLGFREVLTTVTVTGAAAALLIGTVSREHWWVALVLLATLAVVDGLLVQYWLRDASIASLRARLWPFAPSRTGLGHSTLSLRSRVAWRRAASSLLWKEWRQARPLTLTFAAVATAVLLLFSLEVWVEFHAYKAGSLGYDWFKDVQIFVGISLTLVPLFLGIGAGRADRRDGAYRLLANSGVAANAHWMTKHAVWMGLAIGTALWLLACEWLLARFPAVATVPQPLWETARSFAIETFSGGPQFGRPAADPNFAATLALVAFVIVLLYALGHLFSSIIPSAMTSLVLGLISCVALTLICISLSQLEVPFWWTIGLLPLIFLFTGWLRTREWLVERNSLAAWGRVAAGLMIPLVGICCGIIAFRVVQIPAATLPLELQSAQRQGVEGPALKQSPFVDAVKSLTGPPPRSKDDPALHSVSDGWEFADAATRGWVAANEPALKLALEAARQERGDFPNFEWPTHKNGTLNGEGVMILMRLLLDSARELESENKLEAALDNYAAIARLGDDLKRSVGWNPGWRISLRGAALEAMDLWAAQSNQTPALIKRAIDRFQQFEEDTPSEATAILKDWRTERAMVQDRVWRGNNIDQESRSAAETGFVRWCLPWELLRLQRLQDLLFSTSLDGVQLVERQFARSAIRGCRLDRLRGLARPLEVGASNPESSVRVSQRRAVEGDSRMARKPGGAGSDALSPLGRPGLPPRASQAACQFERASPDLFFLVADRPVDGAGFSLGARWSRRTPRLPGSAFRREPAIHRQRRTARLSPFRWPHGAPARDDTLGSRSKRPTTAVPELPGTGSDHSEFKTAIQGDFTTSCEASIQVARVEWPAKEVNSSRRV